MENEVFSRLGVRNVTGTDDRELFLEEFTGEVFGKYNTLCKFQPHTYTRTITEGKAARFDAMGEATSFYFTVGDNLAEKGNKVAHDSFLITLDSMLISNSMIAEIDELMNHYDVRSRYADRMAEALAQTFDRHVATCGIRAARSTAKIPGGDGGSRLFNPDYTTDTDKFVEGVFQSAEIMDGKNISERGRILFVRPKEYYRLVQNDKVIHRDFDGAGSISKGVVHELAGFQIVKTNNLPSTDITGEKYAKYNADCTGTVGLCMTDEAVGTLKRVGLTTEVEWQILLQSTVLVTKMLVGHDVLRPECAVELSGIAEPTP